MFVVVKLPKFKNEYYICFISAKITQNFTIFSLSENYIIFVFYKNISTTVKIIQQSRDQR